jgi:hypothetical protein
VLKQGLNETISSQPALYVATSHHARRVRAPHAAPPRHPRQHSVPRVHAIPGLRSFPRPTRAPRRSNPAPSHVPMRRCTVPRPGARRTVRLGSSPVVTPAGEPPYIRRHCLPTGEHRASRPPLPPSRQARPSTGTPSRPTTSDPPLGPAEAQALAHCPGNVTTPPDFRPQRPAPPTGATLLSPTVAEEP